MDLFEEWLNKENESTWIKRALTDSSYKNYYTRINNMNFEGEINTELATLGDAVIKFCLCDILLDQCEQLSEKKKKYESDEYFITVVAKHYDLLKYLKYDKKDSNKNNGYLYNESLGVSQKFIATCVEAVIGAIYKETHDLESIKELIKTWQYFK